MDGILLEFQKQTDQSIQEEAAKGKGSKRVFY